MTSHVPSLRRPFKRGLTSYDVEDAGIFHGREKDFENLVSMILDQRLLIVIGPSGCGKSSLIKAGVIPALKQQGYPAIYSFVLGHVAKDVLRAVNTEIVGQPAPNLELAIERLYEQMNVNNALPDGATPQDSGLAELRRAIVENFSSSELQTLCFDLGMDYDALPGEAKPAKVREVIVFLHRRKHIEKLVARCRAERPDIDWIQLVPTGLQDFQKTSGDSGPAHERPVILFVDQFEQALHTSHDAQELEQFLQDIVFLLKAQRQIMKIVLVVRADWLFYLASEIRHLKLDLNVYALIFLIDYLTREAARNAITHPLQHAGIRYEERVIDDMLDSLLGYGYEASVDKKFIQPTQLQLVVDSLCTLAEKSGDIQQAFTWHNYEASGKVGSILHGYLSRVLEGRADAWRLLARFITVDGKSSQSLRYSELLAIPAAREVESEIQELARNGLLQIYEREKGETYCRLAHDYLVEAISVYLRENPDQQGWKLAEDWLARGADEWRQARESGKGEELLLEHNRYLHICQYRDKLKLDDGARQLLILSALRYGDSGLGYWLSRSNGQPADTELVVQKLLSPDLNTQRMARKAVASAVQSGTLIKKRIASPDTGLAPGTKSRLHDAVQPMLNVRTDSQQREAATRALWVLKEYKTSRERAQVGGQVTGYWMRDHIRQMALYAISGLLLLALTLGAVVLRTQPAGVWTTIQELKSGPTYLAAIDPGNANTWYAITMGGPGPREGSSLFVRQAGKWVLRSRDFAHGLPTGLVIVPAGASRIFYASFYGAGLMRSDDEGQTWKVMNRGLPSRAITSLLADPTDPKTLYLATNDWRGVLRSVDGGESWGFYDTKDEMYGAEINVLAFTRAGEDALLAGTSDGRILRHLRDGSGWENVYGLSQGAINALVVTPPDGHLIYAATSRGIVLRSEDGGENFKSLGQISKQSRIQFSISSLAADPTTPSLVYASAFGNGGYTLWSSEDMGQTWDMAPAIGLPRTGSSLAILVSQDSSDFVAGTSEGLFTSTDRGMTWDKVNLPAPMASVSRLAVNPNASAPVYAIAGASIYANPSGDLKDWLYGKGLRAQMVRTIAVDPVDAEVAYAGVLLLGEWPVFVTQDGGRTWQQTAEPRIEPNVSDATALAVAKSNNGETVIYVGTLGCGILRSNDGGQSWDTFDRDKCSQNTHPDMPTDVSHMAVNAGDPNTLYVATGQRFYATTDGGRTWHAQSMKIESTIAGIAVDEVETKTVYLITGSDGFWRSNDGGTNWSQPALQGIENAELTALSTATNKAGHVIVGASNGEVWTSADGGNTWRSIRENLAVSSISTIATSSALDDRLLIGSAVDGVAQFMPSRLPWVWR